MFLDVLCLTFLPKHRLMAGIRLLRRARFRSHGGVLNLHEYSKGGVGYVWFSQSDYDDVLHMLSRGCVGAGGRRNSYPAATRVRTLFRGLVLLDLGSGFMGPGVWGFWIQVPGLWVQGFLDLGSGFQRFRVCGSGV